MRCVPSTESSPTGTTDSMPKIQGIQVVAFDADDTLWVNETFFVDAEQRFCDLVADFADQQSAMQTLLEIETRNMPTYGYGIKPFTLSLIEAAITVSDGRISVAAINHLIAGGKAMLEKPVEILPGVETVLSDLSGRYRLVMVTKGDLLDQERKLAKSGLESYFHHIEIVSDKTPNHYRKLVGHLDIQPHEFAMVGNSMKSDVLPVIEIGAYAVHVPFRTTWQHEIAEPPNGNPRFRALKSVVNLSEAI